MKLSERLMLLENMLTNMNQEFIDITQQVNKLEEENERLRQQLTPEVITKSDGLGRGLEALAKLYEDGYHICPENYGREHEGGCIFCQQVLQNVTK